MTTPRPDAAPAMDVLSETGTTVTLSRVTWNRLLDHIDAQAATIARLEHTVEHQYRGIESLEKALEGEGVLFVNDRICELEEQNAKLREALEAHVE